MKITSCEAPEDAVLLSLLSLPSLRSKQSPRHRALNHRVSVLRSEPDQIEQQDQEQ
jgi:hypothetical protein